MQNEVTTPSKIYKKKREEDPHEVINLDDNLDDAKMMVFYK